MSHDVNCPYCGHQQDIIHDDGYGYAEDEVFQQYCGKCENYFVYTTSIHFTYRTAVADCLNGEDHKYIPTNTNPKFLTKMRCSDCSKERELTADEKILYHIPTYEEYVKEMNKPF